MAASEDQALNHDAVEEAAAAFAEAASIMYRLRAPGGCPWDREQTFESIETCTLEEVYEVFDAVSRRDWNNLQEELGDLLLQVLFDSEMASEAGHFTIADVVAGLNRKLIQRHPHVFPEQGREWIASGLPVEGISAAQVVRNWDRIKQAERAEKSRLDGDGTSRSGEPSGSIMDRILRSLPALAEARKLGSAAHKVGFDWPGVDGVFEKINEELAELRTAIDTADDGNPAHPIVQAGHTAADEIGDLLFTVANLARRLGVDPEHSLREANTKFRRRFAYMEKAAGESGHADLAALPLDDLEQLWEEAKRELDGHRSS